MPAAGVHLWKRLKSAILGKKRGSFFKKKGATRPFFPAGDAPGLRQVFLRAPAPQAPGVQGKRPDAEKNGQIAYPEIPNQALDSFLGFSWHFSFYHFYSFIDSFIMRVQGCSRGREPNLLTWVPRHPLPNPSYLLALLTHPHLTTDPLQTQYTRGSHTDSCPKQNISQSG
jgi:hypothetical protein